MRFSTKAEYGLRAMVVLAFCYPETKSIAQISREENISPKYLEHLMSDLRKNGLVKSFKGKTGGYVLAKAPERIRIGEIIEALENLLISVKCESEECKNKKCPSKKVWVKLGVQIRETLYGIRLSDLVS